MTSTEQEQPARVDRREQVAEALRQVHRTAPTVDAYAEADALLPLIARFEREAAAKALEDFAAKWNVWVITDAPQTRGGAAYRAQAEASAIRAAALTDVDGVQS